MTANLAGDGATGKFGKGIKRRKIRAIMQSLKEGSPMYSACKGAHVGLTTFWRWRKADPRLDMIIEAALESQVTVVEDALYKSALSGNTVAQIFFLTNRKGEKWRDRRALVNNVVVNKVGDGKRVDREFVGEEREQEQRLIDFLREAAD